MRNCCSISRLRQIENLEIIQKKLYLTVQTPHLFTYLTAVIWRTVSDNTDKPKWLPKSTPTEFTNCDDCDKPSKNISLNINFSNSCVPYRNWFAFRLDCHYPFVDYQVAASSPFACH